ncbi:MAG: hypothetical protein WAU17_01900, partial [Nitrospirales bacterium]
MSRNRMVYRHPFHSTREAEISLAQRFTISPYLQTIRLPKFSRNPGLVGKVASTKFYTSTTPTGQKEMAPASKEKRGWYEKAGQRRKTNHFIRIV